MEKLWAERRAPQPLDWEALPDKDDQTRTAEIHDQAVWSLKECGEVFEKSLADLHGKLKVGQDGRTRIFKLMTSLMFISL